MQGLEPAATMCVRYQPKDLLPAHAGRAHEECMPAGGAAAQHVIRRRCQLNHFPNNVELDVNVIPR